MLIRMLKQELSTISWHWQLPCEIMLNHMALEWGWYPPHSWFYLRPECSQKGIVPSCCTRCGPLKLCLYSNRLWTPTAETDACWRHNQLITTNTTCAAILTARRLPTLSFLARNTQAVNLGPRNGCKQWIDVNCTDGQNHKVMFCRWHEKL